MDITYALYTTSNQTLDQNQTLDGGGSKPMLSAKFVSIFKRPLRGCCNLTSVFVC